MIGGGGMQASRRLQPSFMRQRQTTQPISLSATRSRRSDWFGVATFFSIGYWKRLWIVQKVVLAQELRIQCGDYFIDWPVLRGLLLALNSLGDSELKYPPYVLNIARLPASELLFFKIDNETFDGMHEFRLGLSVALRRFSESVCSYACDKVYSLLGIVQGGHGIQPDYRLSASQLLETIVSSPSLRTDDQLNSFSQFLHKTLGKHVPSDAKLAHPGEIFYTRTTICGTVEVIGDIFTSV
jgi:hypothetical protein